MNRKKASSICIAFLLLFSFYLGYQCIATSFNADPSDEPEYGSWNVSEHVRNANGDETEWIFMHPASWHFNAVTETLQSNMSNGDYEFSAALVNDSWANRTQSLLWANFTMNTDEDCIFVGPVYACHDNGSFDMVLYGEYYVFLLSWNGTNLTNTVDGTLVEDIDDAINYYSIKKSGGFSPNGAFGNGIYIKTIYNTYCGSLFTKYWGENLDFMDEPVSWAYEGNISTIVTDDAVRWGVAWWSPDVTDPFTVDYDYMNMWRLNYTTVYDATFAPSDYRPFMSFPIMNMSEDSIGDDMITFFFAYFFGWYNMEDDDTATFLYNFTERMNMESRMYRPNSTGAYSQNDTVYYYSGTLTNLAEYFVENWGDEFFPEPEDLEWIPNNVLWLYAQGCPYGDEGNEYDYIFVSIDTEDDGIWDETDRAFYVDSGFNMVSWTGTEVDMYSYGEFLGETFGGWDGYGFFPCIHRYANHLHYWLMIPLDWLVNSKTGSNLDIGDNFGLHIQMGSMNDTNVCVWENWNETACASFVDEGNASVFNTYMNNTDIYDEDEEEGLDLTINTTALGFWGGGAIAGDPPLPPDSYGINITIESNETHVSSGWDESHDINYTINITNTGDGEVTGIVINGTWWNCSCSYWNATLIDTNIDMSDFSFTPCHFTINDADHSSLASGASHEIWYVVRFYSCNESSDYRPLVSDVDVSTDEGNRDNSSEAIHWGRNATEPEGGSIPARDDDLDDDGLSDDLEELIGTDPRLPDTDFDGYTDYAEWLAGTDPLDATDYPGKACSLCNSFLLIPIIFWLFIIIPAILMFLVALYYCDNQKKKERCYLALLAIFLILILAGIFFYLVIC